MADLLRFGLLGLGLGALYALTAQGIVLIYRGSGVLNFAHGAVGMAGAYLWWELHVQHSVPFLLALVVGVCFSALLGVLTYALVMRPLRGASALARLVGTLGVLIVVQSIALIHYGSSVTIVTSSLPLNHVKFGSVIITEDRLILVGIALVLTAVLWAGYRYTRFGLATTAAAEDLRGVAALGLSPDLIAGVNWALGCGLAGLTAILVVPIIGLQVTALTNLVLAALAAGLIGRFSSFPLALIAGLVIGVVQSELTRYTTTTGLAGSVPFLFIVLVLIVSGRGLPLRDYLLERLPRVGTGKIRWRWLVPTVVAAAVVTSVVSAEWSIALTNTYLIALLLLSLVVVTGYAGQVSLAQFALAGTGAFVAGRLVSTQHIPFLLGLLAGIVAAGLVGVAFALPAVRTRGVNLAIITLGLGFTIEAMVFDSTSLTGGLAGTVVSPPTLFGWSIDPIAHPQRYGVVALLFLVFAMVFVANLRRGRVGRRLLAVRNNERAAAAVGIRVWSAKVYAFGISAAIAGLAGILIGFRSHALVFAADFYNFQSILAVGYAVLGGVGFLLGPIFGSIFGTGTIVAYAVSKLFGYSSSYVPLVGGIVLILILLANQNGIAYEIGRLITRRRRRTHEPTPRDEQPPPTPIQDGSGQPSATPVGQPAKSGAFLSVKGLRVQYGGVIAVDDLSVDVRSGEIVALIGPNGGGKTSAIDGITGFTKIAKGEVEFNGSSITNWSVVRRARTGISRSFQSLELFEDMTVEDNLRTAADERDLRAYVTDLAYPAKSALSRHVQLTIDAFRLRDDLRARVDQLPYGKRRLLALARAVATDPQVLLLDEPAAGLSGDESVELAHLVQRMAKEWGLGILLVEHDMDFVMSICDRIVVLDFSRKIAEGPPEKIRSDPAVIAAYLGEPVPGGK